MTLEALFRPRSIAVIGASADPNKIGGRPIAFLTRAGYRGEIYPVNPNQAAVQGRTAYRSLADVPGQVDHAVVAVPATAAPAAIEACVAAGVKAVTMFTAGLGEAGAEGQAIQRRLAERCREAGIRLLGPNSLGLFNVADGVFPTFSAAIDTLWPKPGRIAVASQSGAVATYCFAMMHDRGLGLSHLIATGNEADVDLAECLDWLADDPATGVIVAYLEGCRDGTRLRRALAKAAAAGKPVVAMKVGVSESGAAAAASHTGTLAGADTAYEAVFAAEGVYRVHSIAEMVDVAQACVPGRKPAGRRLGVLTPSGGIGIMLADQATALGFELPPLPGSAQAEVLALVPFAGPRNPVDTTAQVANDRTLLPRIMEIIAAADCYDSILVFLAHMGRNPAIMEPLQPALSALRARHPGPLFVLIGPCEPAMRDLLEGDGFLVFNEPTQAMRALAALTTIALRPMPGGEALAVSSAVALPAGLLDEAAAKAVLADAGIPFLTEHVAGTVEQAVEAARTVGFPVVLKVMSPDIPHKSDVGGVKLGLHDPGAVEQAWHDAMRSARAGAPAARITGALITPMVTDGVETVLGTTLDPTFGPMALVGLGGVFVEILNDVIVRPAPLSRDVALAMIRSLKGYAVLAGARGRAPVDLDRLADALVVLSRFATANADTVASVELNPFIALPSGGVAVDALIVRR